MIKHSTLNGTINSRFYSQCLVGWISFDFNFIHTPNSTLLCSSLCFFSSSSFIEYKRVKRVNWFIIHREEWGVSYSQTPSSTSNTHFSFATHSAFVCLSYWLILSLTSLLLRRQAKSCIKKKTMKCESVMKNLWRMFFSLLSENP